jgi:ubiquinone/menaquinone biosynthesis C-methylase UbiE
MKPDYTHWLHILQCPLCSSPTLQESNATTLYCTHCGQHYPVVDSIPQLMINLDDDTRLDEAAYDAMMGVNLKSHQTVLEMWTTVFQQQGITAGDVLEIGCGSGLFTVPLLRMGCQSVHACDISQVFLQKTHTQCPEAMLWRCDANKLPFADNSFDQIVGHSVLHHFLDYETVLAKACRMLRPSGSLIVFEPVMQGKVLIALLANLIKQTDLHAATPIFDMEDHKKLDRLIGQLSKHLQINNNRDMLAKMEDKYIFDVNALQRTAKLAGFQHTTYCNNPRASDKISIARHLKQYGIATEKTHQYEYLSEAVRASMALLPPENYFTPMGFFVFTKLE